MDNDALRRALLDEDDGAFIAGADPSSMDKEAEGVDPREDTRRVTLRELMAIRDPKERKRYMQDMAARNHLLAMDRPSSVRGAVATQKTAALVDRLRSRIRGH